MKKAYLAVATTAETASPTAAVQSLRKSSPVADKAILQIKERVGKNTPSAGK